MSFIQIIEMRTKNFDELQALGDRVLRGHRGQAHRATVGRHP